MSILKSNKRFILSNLVSNILDEGNQVSLFLNSDGYNAKFSLTVDDKKPSDIYVTFSEDNEKPISFIMHDNFNCIEFIFSLIDNLSIGDSLVKVYRANYHVMTMKV